MARDSFSEALEDAKLFVQEHCHNSFVLNDVQRSAQRSETIVHTMRSKGSKPVQVVMEDPTGPVLKVEVPKPLGIS